MGVTDHLLTVAEVARRLSVSEETVRRLIAHRKLAAVRITRAIRVARSDLDQYIAEHRQETAEERSIRRRATITRIAAGAVWPRDWRQRLRMT